MTVRSALLVLLSLALFSSADAAVYRYVDANGVVHFTNTPTHPKYILYLKDPVSKAEFSDMIRRHSTSYRLEEALVKAVIKAESDYNPRAVSRKGAIGMMQLLPSTARDMSVRDPLNPDENIRGGSRYLRLMLNQFDNNIELALAAYNAGPNAVKKHGGIPPYEETRTYVKRVKRYLEHYRQERDGA